MEINSEESETKMNIIEKSEKIDTALVQLGREIRAERIYDRDTTWAIDAAIDSFLANAGEDSKARLFDILTRG